MICQLMAMFSKYLIYLQWLNAIADDIQYVRCAYKENLRGLLMKMTKFKLRCRGSHVGSMT